ncbi:MAG: ribosomal-protein-serine acetyltransferase [Solirubrobacteraceae bacterium]|nr:ribosomal-protein-serine acetyltransferase [Solirubrobacteraceae bacterium]
MLRRDLPGGAHLRLLEESDAGELFALTDANRAHLEPWMPWIGGTRAPDDTLEFIRATRRQLGDDNGMQLAIVGADGAIAGVVGFHRFDWANRATSIGYWVAADRQGRGLVTEAVRALVAYAFDDRGLHRIEIAAAVDNARSRAVPERLGFAEEGVQRAGERHGERYLDLVVYALLATDPR